jgi:hypothetical protein
VRQYERQRKANHSKPYLKKRPIHQFEKLMLALGGKEILERVTGKTIDLKSVDTVYDWSDPTFRYNYATPEFILVESLNVR